MSNDEYTNDPTDPTDSDYLLCIDEAFEEATAEADEAEEAAALATDEYDENSPEDEVIDGDTELPTPASSAPALRPIPQYAERGPKLLRRIWEGIKADTSAWSQRVWVGKLSGETLDDAVVEYIRENQTPPWDCGTAYCISGHAAMATGARLTPNDVNRLVNPDYPEQQVDVDHVVDPETGETVTIKSYGAKVLGLNDNQANVLFSGDNTDPYRIELQVRALEENPDDDLYNVYVEGDYASRKKAQTWKVLHGFVKPEHRARRVYDAVRRAFRYEDATLASPLTVLVLTKGADFTDEEYYNVQALSKAVKDSFPKAWEDVSADAKADVRYYADTLRNVAHKVA